MWACRFTIVDVPKAAQRTNRQAELKRRSYRPEPIGLRAVKPDRWFRVRMSLSTLAGFVRLNTGIP